jgi:hypothetical protein
MERQGRFVILHPLCDGVGAGAKDAEAGHKNRIHLNKSWFRRAGRARARVRASGSARIGGVGFVICSVLI